MIKKVINSYISSFVLFENGDLWGCGENFEGHLGLKDIKRTSTFLKVFENIEKVYRDFSGTFFFKKDKTLWYSGLEEGIGKDTKEIVLEKISDNVKSVFTWFSKSYKKNFVFCLKNDGDLIEFTTQKVLLTDVKKIKYISKGIFSHLLAFKNDNSLWKLTEIDLGKLNEKSFRKVLDDVNDVFTESKYEIPFFIQRADSSIWLFEESYFEKGIKFLDNIKEVKVCDGSWLFLKEDGTLFAFGVNKCGRFWEVKKKIDHPIPICKNVKKFYIDLFNIIVLRDDNILLENDTSKVPTDPSFYPFKKISKNVKDFFSGGRSLCIIKKNDELWGRGSIANYFPGRDYFKFISEDVESIENITAGKSFLIARKDCSLLCFGANEYRHLGVETEEKEIKTPIVNNFFKKYYNMKETADVINSIFKGKNL